VASLSGSFGNIPHNASARKILYNTSPDSSDHFQDAQVKVLMFNPSIVSGIALVQNIKEILFPRDLLI